jgi:ferredoxin, 2Fe-2S
LSEKIPTRPSPYEAWQAQELWTGIDFMTEIHVVGLDGSERTISASPGATLMEALRDSGFDVLLALCGGCCSCATCHVYVETQLDVQNQNVSDDEDDLLESSEHREANSRLSCQIHLSDSLAELRIRLAPAD